LNKPSHLHTGIRLVGDLTEIHNMKEKAINIICIQSETELVFSTYYEPKGKITAVYRHTESISPGHMININSSVLIDINTKGEILFIEILIAKSKWIRTSREFHLGNISNKFNNLIFDESSIRQREYYSNVVPEIYSDNTLVLRWQDISISKLIKVGVNLFAIVSLDKTVLLGFIIKLIHLK
jgi:uncharacterized protein YuzE